MRLWQLGLLHKASYCAFAAMQLIMISRDVVLFSIPVHSLRYTTIWEVSLPLVIVSHAGAGVCCYAAIAKLYPKIGRFAAQLFDGSIIITALLSTAALPFELRQLKPEPILRSLYFGYRWTDTLLGGGLLLAVAFFSKFPSPLKKLPSNLVRHTGLLACYFGVYALASLLPAWRTYIDPIRCSAVCLLYSTWIFALSRSGEDSEPWPLIDHEAAQVIIKRAIQTEQLYHQAAAEMLRLQVSRPE